MYGEMHMFTSQSDLNGLYLFMELTSANNEWKTNHSCFAFIFRSCSVLKEKQQCGNMLKFSFFCIFSILSSKNQFV